jgi:hypothetical protein
MILQAEDMGETPNRDDMWCVTHTKKDGNPVTEKAGEAIVSAKYVLLREYGHGKNMSLCRLYVQVIICMFCAGSDKSNYRTSGANRTSVFTGVHLLVA